MNHRKSEDPHHTPEQVRGYLDEAERIVDELEVASDLREIAYAKAINLLAAKQLFYEQIAPMGALDLSRGH